MDELLEGIFQLKLSKLKQYPSVYRRLVLATKRASEARETEEVNEVGLHCREILNDYAQRLYNPDFSLEPIKGANTKEMLKATIKHYSQSGRLRSVVSSLEDLVDKSVDYTNQVTHSYSVTPDEAPFCIDMCMTLIFAIETLILNHAQQENGFYDYFGVLKCPQCRSSKLEGSSYTDYDHDRLYYFITCTECGWTDGTEA